MALILMLVPPPLLYLAAQHGFTSAIPFLVGIFILGNLLELTVP
jgi:hypothetical protein